MSDDAKPPAADEPSGEDAPSAPRKGGGGLTVLGAQAEADRAFLEAERPISSKEFLDAVLEDKREEVAKMIVQDDRLVRSRDASGASAVLLASYHGLEEMVGLLLRAGVDLDLFEAAAVGDTERVVALAADHPERLAETSADGFPPLQLACYFGRVPTAKALVELGAPLGLAASNHSLVQPLHSAAACRDAEAALALVRTLLAAGADPNVVQAGGFTPLQSAASAGRRALADLLLEHGADLGAEADLGQTAASLAAERGHAELAAYLSSLASSQQSAH